MRTIESVCRKYVASRDICDAYVKGLFWSVRKLAEDGIVLVDDLSVDTVNEHLMGLTGAAVSRQNHRRRLLTIWRYGYTERLVKEPPLGVRTIKSRPTPPRAWSQDQLNRLVNRCREFPGSLRAQGNPVPKSVVLLAWTLVGFETGLRFSDIHHLKRSDIRNDTITVVCQKTGKLACRRISDECQRALYEMCRRSPDETVFLWALSRRHAFVTWKKFLKWAGMEGSSKWLRRSGATAVESISPGAAQHFLGHSSADLARRHYIDPSLLPPVISPPPLKLAATG